MNPNPYLMLPLFIIMAILITFVIVCCYIKLLSVIRDKLWKRLYKVSETRSDTRQNSCIEVRCVYYFDSIHQFVNASMSNIFRVIKDFIRIKTIYKQSYDCNYSRCNESPNTNFKRSFPFRMFGVRHCKETNTDVSSSQPKKNDTGK